MSRLEKWIEVDAPIGRVFDLFSDFENMPQWMHGVSEVRRVGNNRVRWVLTSLSSGTAVQWETETIAFDPTSHLTWHGAGGDVDASGDVTFEETKRGTTLLRVQLGYAPPSEYSGAVAIAQLLNGDLAQHLEEDLQRFKRIAEEHQTIDPVDVPQSRAVAAMLSVSPTLAQEQLASSEINQKVERRNIEARGLDTHQDVTFVMTTQELRDEDVIKQADTVNTQADRPLLQRVELYRDESPEVPLVQSENVQPTRALNIDDGSTPPLFQHGPKVLPDDAPTIVTVPQPAPPGRTQASAQTFANQRETMTHARTRNSPRLLYVLLAAIAFALGVGLLWFALQRESNNSLASSTSSTSPLPASTIMPEQTQPVSDTAAPPLSTKSTTDISASAVTENIDRGVETDVPAESKSLARATEQGRLRAQLSDWITATNARDVERQMSFYTDVVQRYYLTSYVPRERVREDKSRLFSKAKSVDITAGDPKVTFDRRGNVATMRFRKQYDIENSRLSRRGEVLQELKWLKTDKEGWRIISERDLRVIR